jgi:hypothetical protein
MWSTRLPNWETLSELKEKYVGGTTQWQSPCLAFLRPWIWSLALQKGDREDTCVLLTIKIVRSKDFSQLYTIFHKFVITSFFFLPSFLPSFLFLFFLWCWGSNPGPHKMLGKYSSIELHLPPYFFKYTTEPQKNESIFSFSNSEDSWVQPLLQDILQWYVVTKKRGGKDKEKKWWARETK